ncbi:hypothetical protein IV102_01445 [bacterium]|nr:hypothetical protein [bacterium]
MESRPSRNSQLRAFLVVFALIALAYRLFPGSFPLIPGQRWDLHEVTIKGFRAGVTREQIEARLGPGSPLSDQRCGWMWNPPLPPIKPDGTLPIITFEMLTLEKWDHRWCLSGSQFEYHGQKFVTQIHCADSIWQGTIQQHFGPGNFSGQGDDISLHYRDSDDSKTEWSFTINNIDEFGPNSTRAVTGTCISWPEPAADQPDSPKAGTSPTQK